MARELTEDQLKDAPRTSAASPGENPGRIAIPTRTSSERSRVRQRATSELSSDDAPALEDVIDLDDDGEEARFLRTERRVPVRRTTIARKTVSKLKLACVLAVIVVALGGMTYALKDYATHSWRFRIASTDNVTLTGVNNASRTQVMEVAGADVTRNIFSVSLDERRQKLEQIPWVESATVMRVLPNRLAVEIRERVPVAFAQVGSRVNLIDANGVVMGMPANKQTKYSFPIIRGITDTEPLSSRAAAMRIYNRMAKDLDSGGPNAEYTKQVSEVDLGDPEDVKVTTTPPREARVGGPGMARQDGGTLLIHLGNADYLLRYKLYVDHIGEWRKQFPNLQSVDLRYEGQIVVNPDAARPVPAPRLIEAAAPVAEAKPVKAAVVTKKANAHRGGAEARRKTRRHVKKA